MSPYFVCYGMEVGSPFSLRTSKAEVGGVYENAARCIFLCRWVLVCPGEIL